MARELRDKREYTYLVEAVERLTQVVGTRSKPERVDVRAAFGRVLSADVRAPYDSPPRDVSHFDGFAVRSEDTANATETLPARLRPRRTLVIEDTARALSGRAKPPRW